MLPSETFGPSSAMRTACWDLSGASKMTRSTGAAAAIASTSPTRTSPSGEMTEPRLLVLPVPTGV